MKASTTLALFGMDITFKDGGCGCKDEGLPQAGFW